ncbi:glycosyltransferase family protein [Dyadobacter sp. MSC1_007]|jgi:hypothetical protein|uniref:hypothetical protein n=1 Tax=Dyadobacter sp. MSC1_007 TaxID=2909264 RepID=UPI00202EC47D|nr:hypothetical protein [Dyadobacter sp. MSC1_007]
MEENNKPNVLVMINNNFAALNMIHSGLIRHLAGKYNVILLSDLIGEHELAQINKHFNIEVQATTASLCRETRLVRWSRLFQKALFCHFFQIRTLLVQMRGRGGFVYLGYRLFCLIFWIKWLNVRLLALSRQWIISQTSQQPLDACLDRLNLHGVISTSPLDIRENQIVNILKKRNIKSAAIVISWDNLSSKGLMNADHDIVLVWNYLMAEEYRRYYAVFKSKSRICVSGIPRFDLYFKYDVHDLYTFQRKLRIKPSNRIILLATSSVKHIPSHNYIIKHLLEYLDANPDVILLVRCHPGDRPENYASFRNHANFHCFPAHSNIENASRLPPLDFLNTLRMQLEACHVCIQIASTMRLDAAACNKPVISIAYEETLTRYAQSVSQLYSYSHQIPLNDLHIDRMVCDKHALFNALDELLDPGIPNPDYRKIIKPFLHCQGVNATSLTIQHLNEWLQS